MLSASFIPAGPPPGRSRLFVPVLREHEYALLGEQICQAPAGIEGIGPTVAVEGDAALDANANLVAHRDKIADRAEMNIGRFVPRMREEM